jgi:hypothetical protein
MKLFAKPAVTWNEPEAFRISEDNWSAKKNSRWMRPTFFLVLVTMYTFGWEISKLNPNKRPPDFVVAFPLFLVLSFSLVYGLPWFLRRVPATINLYPSGLIRMGAQRIRPLKEMSGYNWLKEDSYFVLSLINKKGRAVLYGVPDAITRDKIVAVLRQAGLNENSMPLLTDFKERRKAIWGQRVFSAAEVQAMRDEESE